MSVKCTDEATDRICELSDRDASYQSDELAMRQPSSWRRHMAPVVSMKNGLCDRPSDGTRNLCDTRREQMNAEHRDIQKAGVTPLDPAPDAEDR